MFIKCVTEWLDKSEEIHHDKIVYRDEKTSITFSELKQSSMCIGGRFSDFDIFKQPIIIYMGRTVRCLICFWGCAYSGNYYTPIDVNTPIGRAQKIAECLKSEYILTDREHVREAHLICPNA